jgi:hypothetical protein
MAAACCMTLCAGLFAGLVGFSGITVASVASRGAGPESLVHREAYGTDRIDFSGVWYMEEKFSEQMKSSDFMDHPNMASMYMQMEERDKCNLCMGFLVPFSSALRDANLQDALVRSIEDACDDRVGLIFRGTCKEFGTFWIPPFFSLFLDVLPEYICADFVGMEETGDGSRPMCDSTYDYEYMDDLEMQKSMAIRDNVKISPRQFFESIPGIIVSSFLIVLTVAVSILFSKG